MSRKLKYRQSYKTSLFKQSKITKNISRKVPATSTRIYSNSMSDCIKTFCCECDEVVNMSGLRKHLRRHGMGLVEYRNLYGDHYTQVIQMVFHTCMYCKKDIVLDYDTLRVIPSLEEDPSKHISSVSRNLRESRLMSRIIFY